MENKPNNHTGMMVIGALLLVIGLLIGFMLKSGGTDFASLGGIPKCAPNQPPPCEGKSLIPSRAAAIDSPTADEAEGIKNPELATAMGVVKNINDIYASNPDLLTSFRLDSDQIKSDVDLSTTVNTTKKFSMKIPDMSVDGEIITGPGTTLVNCGMLSGLTVCCQLGTNSGYVYSPWSGNLVEVMNLCIDNEWDE